MIGRRQMLDPKLLVRLFLLGALVAGIALAIIYREHIDAASLEAWVADFGPWAPIVFILAYVVATVFFLPGLLFTLAAGALFGPYLGTLYSLIGATAGATIAFLVARYALSEWLAQRSPARVRQVVEGVEAEGWRFVAVTRLMPFIPFNALNYVLGLTRIKVWHYAIASFLFMAPGGAAYAYLGYAGREVATGDEDLVQKALLGLAALGLIGFLPRLIKRLRRKKDAEREAPQAEG
jgi:uncharacterized membrane protein YdjX (TVP38/TMEM64 family)